MIERIIRCPVCNEIIATQEGGKKEIVVKQFHGICWGDVGYSMGGWGNRKNFMDKFSEKVCCDCFTALADKIKEFKDFANSLKKSNHKDF